MPKVNIFEYDSTAGNNSDVDSIDLSEGMNPSAVNNAIRELMAHLKDFTNTAGGAAVSSGTDTVTLTTSAGLTAYADGILVGFIAGGTNTGATTLNIDTVGAKKVLKHGGDELGAGDITSGMPCMVFYDASADTAAGAWMLLNPKSASGDNLTDIAGLATTDGGFIVGDGSNFVLETGATVRTSLGLAIGTDVQAFNAYLADIAAITPAQGDVIYFDGTDFVNLGPGTSGQFLQTQGAAANPQWAAAGGALEFVSTNAITLASSITVTSMAAGYDYIVVLENFCPVTDDQDVYLRFSDDGGSTYEADVGDYGYSHVQNAADSTDHQATQLLIGEALGNDAGNQSTIEVVLTNPNDTSEKTSCRWTGFVMNASANPVPKAITGGGLFEQGTNAVSAIEFSLEGAGNFKAQGDITVWRRKRS